MTALHPRAQSAHIRSASLSLTAMMFATSGQGGNKKDIDMIGASSFATGKKLSENAAGANGQDDAKKGMPGAGQDFSFPTTSKVDGLSPDHPMFAQAGRPAHAMNGACYQ